MNDADDFFAPPAFDASNALTGLERRLGELKLTRREGRFEWRGMPVVELTIDGSAIRARRAKRPSRSPEWESVQLANAAQVRRFIDDTQRALARWSERDD